MTTLRKSILFLIFHLLIVFNLERLGGNTSGFSQIQPYVYGLVVLSVFSTLAFYFIQRHSIYYSMVMWALIYIGTRVVFISQRPILGGVNTYLTITELAILSITVFLSYELAHSLRELEEVVVNVTLPKGRQRVQPIDAAEADIDTEFARSRRYNRPLSVLVVNMLPTHNQFDLARVVKEIQQSMYNRYLQASMAQLINKVARRTDLIIEKDSSNSFVLICPETGADGVYILAERLQTIATKMLGIELRFGMASFPDEALTFEDLLKKAEVQAITPSFVPTYSFLEEEVELEQQRT
jgi:GGDEF domain-containing protein